METTIIYLIVSLLLAVSSFYLLHTGKYPFLRILYWITFYASTAVLVNFWINFFFPETAHRIAVIDFHLTLAFWGRICLIFLVAAGFFLWVYLAHRNSRISLDKITRVVSGFITIILLALVILISVAALWVRNKQESKLVTANITQADIFPERSIAESITQDDIFPKVEPNVIIPEGGSLCGSLGITKQYALQFAKINNLEYHYLGDKLIVLVQPGDEFMPVGKLWTPVKKIAK